MITAAARTVRRVSPNFLSSGEVRVGVRLASLNVVRGNVSFQRGGYLALFESSWCVDVGC